MPSTRRIRLARSVLALAAGASLLGLSACGDDGAEAPSPAETSAESTTGGGTGDEGGQQTSSPPADDGDDAGRTDDAEPDDDNAGADEGAGEDQDGNAGPPERTRLVLVTEPGVDDSAAEGTATLGSSELAALLGDAFGATAECADALPLEAGASADCVGPVSIERPEPTQEWVASTVFVPSPEGLTDGARAAVLFSTGAAFPEDAEELLAEDVVVTGVGFGSAFGLNPLDAEQVADSTLQTLESEFAYVRVDRSADWSEVTCEDGLDFTDFETVDCTAATADGDSWELEVAPGTYANNDQGLLVGIVTTSRS